jgi:hypothetical protein
VPLLSKGKKYHFFLSKHEKRKHIALTMANALKEVGFKVWVSQHQATAGHSTDKGAMQQGVRESESILLFMTKGIFQRDRVWVTKTEVTFGLETCGCSLICVAPMDDKHTFDFDIKCHQLSGQHVHPKECCQNVDTHFQCIAKAIPAAIDVAPWYARGGKSSTEDVQKCIKGIVKRYLGREKALKKLKKEIALQSSLKKCQDEVSFFFQQLDNVEGGEVGAGSGEKKREEKGGGGEKGEKKEGGAVVGLGGGVEVGGAGIELVEVEGAGSAGSTVV